MNPLSYLLGLALRIGYSKFVGESFGRNALLMFLILACFASWFSFFTLGSTLGLVMGILSIIGIGIMVYSFITDKPEPEDEPWKNI